MKAQLKRLQVESFYAYKLQYFPTLPAYKKSEF